MKPQLITSRQNKVFKHFLELLDTRGINENGKALVFGKKAVADLVKNSSTMKNCLGIIYPEGYELEFKVDFTFYSVSEGLFKELDIFRTDSPILIVRIPDFNDFSPSENLPGCSVFVPFQDPRNMGGILRTAAAFGVNQIILGPGAANPFNPLSSRAASGTLFSHKYYKCLTDWEFEFGNNVSVALDLNGTSLDKFSFPKDFIFVPGREGQGQPKNYLPTHRVNIPISKDMDSLNAMVATSIALYQWSTSTSRR